MASQPLAAVRLADCRSLKLVVLPESVTFIASDAFAGLGNVLLICTEGSYAAQYAQEHRIPCVVVSAK